MKNTYFLVFLISVVLGFSFVILDFYLRNPEISAEYVHNPAAEDANSLLALGKQYYYEGNIEKAIANYESALNHGGDFNLIAKIYIFI